MFMGNDTIHLSWSIKALKLTKREGYSDFFPRTYDTGLREIYYLSHFLYGAADMKSEERAEVSTTGMVE